MQEVAAVRLIALLSILFFFVLFSILSPLATAWLSIAEFLHVCSFVFLFELLYKNKGWKGISFKSQYLVILMALTRYFDILLFPNITFFSWILKAIFILIAVVATVLLYVLRDTYEWQKDTANFLFFILIAFTLGLINFLIVSTWRGFGDFIWVSSHYIQSFALIPQFIFSFRDPDNNDRSLNIYIFLLGGYRLLYFLHWISFFIFLNTFYFAGPLSLLIYIPFLIDFSVFKYFGHSILSRWTLQLDEKLSAFRISLLSNAGNAFPRNTYVDMQPEIDQSYTEELHENVDKNGPPHSDDDGVPPEGREFFLNKTEFQLDEDPHFSNRRFCKTHLFT
ncbi:putative KDEL endoplasmic reticulum proteinretention receptor 2 (KDELR2) [Cardiosporidium cionae]|uniref:KDEL endoplasmic reticulum proteinretention receptor 2 (KDELR2) n=1 Tax=Cardiosporidium cionae TaxID=476202 RepID=A0ABQ7JBI0_9APIC|nr:putative KDEL endoplasmic reticulum proteinretention receptor 2 (KDELR2) [Cardiosporidium cionae]|eukprot:KAF8821264.1 putative KDEL endoplasmic reticulum proteinretention receptor 2 (KDELR2) [Cardiosporidium cionae]